MTAASSWMLWAACILGNNLILGTLASSEQWYPRTAPILETWNPRKIVSSVLSPRNGHLRLNEPQGRNKPCYPRKTLRGLQVRPVMKLCRLEVVESSNLALHPCLSTWVVRRLEAVCRLGLLHVAHSTVSSLAFTWPSRLHHLDRFHHSLWISPPFMDFTTLFLFRTKYGEFIRNGAWNSSFLTYNRIEPLAHSLIYNKYALKSYSNLDIFDVHQIPPNLSCCLSPSNLVY